MWAEAVRTVYERPAAADTLREGRRAAEKRATRAKVAQGLFGPFRPKNAKVANDVGRADTIWRC